MYRFHRISRAQAAALLAGVLAWSVPAIAAAGEPTQRQVEHRPARSVVERVSSMKFSEAASVRLASIPFDVRHDGFLFANWQDTSPTANVTYTDLVSVVGSAALCGSASGACHDSPATQRMIASVNEMVAAGRCEGMALAAFNRFRSAAEPASTLAREEVHGELTRWSLTQLSPAARAAARTTRGQSASNIIDALVNDLRLGGGATLGLHGAHGSHAVLPIGVVAAGSVAVVRAYDPNAPGRVQLIELNLAENTWKYRVRNASGTVLDSWFGGRGSLDVVTMDDRRNG